jgi:hypothetical protein
VPWSQKKRRERCSRNPLIVNRLEKKREGTLGTKVRGCSFLRVMPHTLPKRARSVRASKIAPKPLSKKLFQHTSKTKLKTAAKSLT